MFFLASLVMVSAVHAHFALAHLGLRIGRIEPVFVGEKIRVPVEALNLSGRPRVSLAVAPTGSVFKEAMHVAVAHLPAHGSESVELSLPTVRRGRLRPGRFALTTIYPMGFFRAWRYEATEAACLVYPLPRGSLLLPVGPALTADLPAGTGSGGEDYAGTRPYQVGESQRHIDWRAVARGQPLLVKKFSGAGSRRVWLEYADTLSLPDVEDRLCQLSLWIVEADREGLAYGLRLPGFEAEPTRGHTHYHRCLGALALFDEKGGAEADAV